MRGYLISTWRSTCRHVDIDMSVPARLAFPWLILLRPFSSDEKASGMILPVYRCGANSSSVRSLTKSSILPMGQNSLVESKSGVCRVVVRFQSAGSKKGLIQFDISINMNPSIR